MGMKLALFLISTVFLFLVSAQEADQTEVADSNYDLHSSNVQLLRQEREAKNDKKKLKKSGKKGKVSKDRKRKANARKNKDIKEKRKRGKNGKKGKRKRKDKKSQKNRRKKNKNDRRKKSGNREKLILCCCKQKENCIEKPDLDATICVEKICLKEGEKTCPKLFFGCPPDKPTPVPSPPHGPPVPPPHGPCPTCPPPGCADDIAKKMKEFKKATNFLKQWKRAQIFLGRIEKKAGKSDAFNDGAMALGSATKNGTMCAGGPSDPMATEAYNVLKDCEKNIKDDCKCSVKLPECKRASITRQASTPAPAPAAAPAPATPPPASTSKCPKDLQNVVDETNKCPTKTGDELCKCFNNLPKIPDCCNIQTELKEITACNTKCQATWSKCSGKLKEAGPLVD